MSDSKPVLARISCEYRRPCLGVDSQYSDKETFLCYLFSRSLPIKPFVIGLLDVLSFLDVCCCRGITPLSAKVIAEQVNKPRRAGKQFRLVRRFGQAPQAAPNSLGGTPFKQHSISGAQHQHEGAPHRL